MNEKEIIKRCQNGDKAAFNELIRVFYPYVTKYLLKLSHDETLTEDLTQDVFLKVIRTIERFNPNGKASFATYVITIAKNTFIGYTRRSKNVFSDLSDIDLKSDDNIENSVITSMQYREVLKYIDSLPPNDFSFPSGHMALSVASVIILWNTSRLFGISAAILGFLILFSRMYLFLHYPSDILGGIALGITVSYFILRVIPC